MNEITTNSRKLNGPERCQYRSPKGKRCRLRTLNPASALCFRHASREVSGLEAANLRQALAGDTREFKSASEINNFLGRLLLLLSEDRVTPRRAAVLAYINNLLLRTLPAINRELNPDSEEPPRIDFGDLLKPAPSFPDAPPPSESRALGAL